VNALNTPHIELVTLRWLLNTSSFKCDSGTYWPLWARHELD